MLSWIFLSASFSLFASTCGQLPSYLPVCYRDDPGVEECLKNVIQNLLPIFKSGSADFDLASLDPLKFETIHNSYQSPIIGGTFSIPDSQVKGLSDMKILNVRLNLNNPRKLLMDFDVFLPFMNVKAIYNMDGNVARIPVKVNGKLDFDLEDLSLRYHIDGDIKRIGNQDYIVLNSFQWRFRNEGMKKLLLRNDNVVDNRPALNRVVTTVIRTSWRQIKDAMLPSLMPEADKSLKSLFTKFFMKYPYDIIFPSKALKLTNTSNATSTLPDNVVVE